MSGNRVAATPASLEDEVEDVPRNDGDDDEEDPFTEEEVAQMHEEIRELAQQMYTNEEEYNNFLSELDAELEENNDLQERGHILLDVLEYLQNPEEGEEGDYGVGDDTEGAPARPATAGGDGDEVEEMEPYPGEEGLQELWKELQEVCSEDDIKRLEDELDGKRPEEQWKILMEVYEYLSEEQERERQEFEAWQPTKAQLEKEWREMMARVPAEDVDEVQADWKKASVEDKKQMVWDVRKLLDEQEEDGDNDEPAAPPKPTPGRNAPPPPRGGYSDEGGKSEVRRRGGKRSDDLEYDFERAPDGGDWDEYFTKEARKAKGGGRSYALVGGALVLLLTLALLLTSTLVAEEDQSVLQSAIGVLGLGSPAQPAAVSSDLPDLQAQD